ncbi:ribonuclease H family protein [Flavicella sp.]|uniref:ribonuclease H family protein n=1 Tax=Flavicella sp. TaxID=2957742 RepID=UPI00301B2643
MAKKYYVVWEGKNRGVFTSWSVCKKNIDGYSGAKYKSFADKKMAEKAFRGTYDEHKGLSTKKKELTAQEKKAYGKPILDTIAVDAACSGNPGKMEYRGVATSTGTQLFIQGPYKSGTNNIGEFLALVHGLAWLQQKKQPNLPIYSDSRIAISWVKQRKCKTKLPLNKNTEVLFDLIKRAELWLKKNPYQNPILKWETKAWGEIPADFGRK